MRPRLLIRDEDGNNICIAVYRVNILIHVIIGGKGARFFLPIVELEEIIGRSKNDKNRNNNPDRRGRKSNAK